MSVRLWRRLAESVSHLKLGRWVGIVVLVVGLIGFNVAVAQAGTAGPALASQDGAARVVGQSDADKRFALRAWSGVLGVAADDEVDNDNEEEELEFEEDGLLPSGQAEQRAQKRGEKAETKHEDAPNE